MSIPSAEDMATVHAYIRGLQDFGFSETAIANTISIGPNTLKKFIKKDAVTLIVKYKLLHWYDRRPR